MRASEERGFTLLELLTVVALIGILAMIGMAGLIAARRAANEASAIGSLRAINYAQYSYAASCANGYYASSLPMLSAAPPNGPPFIAPDLGAAATVHKSGFVITMARGTDSAAATEPGCNAPAAPEDLVDAYYATADPVNAFSGARHFWTNAQGVIFVNPDAPILHRAGRTAPPAAVLEAQSPTGGAGARGTGKDTDNPGSDPPPKGRPR